MSGRPTVSEINYAKQVVAESTGTHRKELELTKEQLVFRRQAANQPPPTNGDTRVDD